MKKTAQETLSKYQKYVSDNYGIHSFVWSHIIYMTQQYMGDYDTEIDYVGPGKFLTKLIPKLCFNEGAYCHDGGYRAIEAKDIPFWFYEQYRNAFDWYLSTLSIIRSI